MEAVIGTESGESYQVELGEEQVSALTGLKVGDEVDGSVLGVRGYTLRITGGSDTEGFPMRASVEGTGRRKLLLKGGTGAKNLEKGERRRKSVRGNTVSGQLSQVNMKVVEEGDEDIETLLGAEPEGEESGEGGEDSGEEEPGDGGAEEEDTDEGDGGKAGEDGEGEEEEPGDGKGEGETEDEEEETPEDGEEEKE